MKTNWITNINLLAGSHADPMKRNHDNRTYRLSKKKEKDLVQWWSILHITRLKHSGCNRDENTMKQNDEHKKASNFVLKVTNRFTDAQNHCARDSRKKKQITWKKVFLEQLEKPDFVKASITLYSVFFRYFLFSTLSFLAFVGFGVDFCVEKMCFVDRFKKNYNFVENQDIRCK